MKKRNAFTLAESRLACTNNQVTAKAAFTLAEVLITLAIIGVVAALTIPAIVRNYQERAWSTASMVFQRKLGEALKVMNTQQTLAGYSTTEDFVNELKKHIRITKICKNDDITSCFEDKVYWGADKEEIEMEGVKRARNFGKEDWGTETIGVQFADGVSGIIAYNPECSQDPYNNTIITTSQEGIGTDCLAMLYDTSGYKKPNTQLKDLRTLNVQSLNGSDCAIKLNNGLCFTTPFIPAPVTSLAECEEIKDELGINGCCTESFCAQLSKPYTDYWAGAVKACGGTSNMPTKNQLTQITSLFYKYNSRRDDNEFYSDLAIASGFPANPKFCLWSNDDYDPDSASARCFFDDGPHSGVGTSKYLSTYFAVCLSK